MHPSAGHIAYIVSHGFAARMLVQTNLLGRLKESGFRVSLIVSHAEDPVLQNYCSEHGISLLEFQSRRWIWKSHYGLYRSYFLEDLSVNPALYEKHHFEINRLQPRYKILKVIPRLLWFFQKFFKKSTGLRKGFRWMEQIFLNDRQAKKILAAQNIDLLVSTYPVNVHEGILLHHAKKLKISTCIHLLSWDNITCKGHFYSTADWYLAWGPVMQSELRTYYGVSNDRIFVTGVPHFDLHEEMKTDEHSLHRLHSIGVDGTKSFILFGMSSPRFVPHEIDIVEWLAEQIEADRFGPQLQLLIRPHPQNVQGGFADLRWLPRLEKLQSKRIHLMVPILAKSRIPWSMELNDMLLLSAALKHCLVCINSCSTLSIDALMSGKHNIAPMFDGSAVIPYWNAARRLLDYTHIKKFTSLGGTLVVSNYSELQAAIEKHLYQDHCFMDDLQFAKAMECGNQTGNATEKVIDSLSKMIIHNA